MAPSADSEVDRRKFIQLTGASATVGVGSMLAGCNTNDSGSTTTTSGGDSDDGQDEVTATETDSESSEIQTGGTLTVAMQNDFDTLHPHKIPGTTGSTMAENFGNALVAATPEGDIVPDLAAEMPEISEDGLTYTFQLREGVQFHPPYDRELTAEDVVENWRTILDEEYGAYGRSTYQGILVGEGIDPEETVQQTGEYEVTFNLDKPFAPFLIKQAKMSAFGWFTIVPMEAVEEMGEDFGTASAGVVATGPFIYRPEESTSGSNYVYEANPDYFKEGAGGQLPYVDRLVYEVAPESSVRDTALQSGDIDINESVAATDIENVQSTDGVGVVSKASSSKTNQWVNTQNFEPFTKKKVRKALLYAANRQAVVDTKFQGFAAVAHSPLPPWHWAYDEEACVTYDHNPEQAQTLLEEAGHTDFSFKCEPTNQPKFVDVAEILQQNYQAVGMDMSVEPASKGTTYDPLVGGWDDESIPPESFNSMIENFTWGYSADDYTYATFHTGVPFNYSYYSNEAADEAMAAARQTPDREERKEHYRTAQREITDDMPQPFLVWNNVSHGFRTRVNNFDVYPTAYMQFESVWLSE